MPPPSPNKITSTLLFWDYFWLLLRKLFSCHLVMTQRERKYNPLRDSKSPCERTRVHIVVITLCVCFGVFTLASIFTDVSCALYENSPLQRDTFSALWCPVPWPLGRYTRKAQMTGSDPLKKKKFLSLLQLIFASQESNKFAMDPYTRHVTNQLKSTPNINMFLKR